MEATLGMRAIKDLFSFPFRDPTWKTKFLLGSLIFIGGFYIPFVPWIALWGYAARVMRSSISGVGTLHLPAWDDWGDLLVEGLKLSIVSLLLSLPAVIVFLVGYGVYFGGFIGAITMQSIMGEQVAAPFIMLVMLAMFFMFFAMAFGTLLVVIAWFLIPPLSAHVVFTRRLGVVFSVGQWWKILWANPGGFFLVFLALFSLWALQYLLFYLLYLTIVLCMFIPLVVAPLTFYTIVVASVMAGQSYREAREKLDQPSANQPSTVDGLAET